MQAPAGLRTKGLACSDTPALQCPVDAQNGAPPLSGIARSRRRRVDGAGAGGSPPYSCGVGAGGSPPYSCGGAAGSAAGGRKPALLLRRGVAGGSPPYCCGGAARRAEARATLAAWRAEARPTLAAGPTRSRRRRADGVGTGGSPSYCCGGAAGWSPRYCCGGAVWRAEARPTLAARRAEARPTLAALGRAEARPTVAAAHTRSSLRRWAWLPSGMPDYFVHVHQAPGRSAQNGIGRQPPRVRCPGSASPRPVSAPESPSHASRYTATMRWSDCASAFRSCAARSAWRVLVSVSLAAF